MSMKICLLEHSVVYETFAKEFRSSRVAIKKDDDKTEYLGCYIDGKLVGVAGWLHMSDKHIRLKSAYVRPEYRGRKVYSNLWETRINRILLYKPEVLTAYCTEMSLPKFLKSGFEVHSVGRNGITYVKQKLKQ